MSVMDSMEIQSILPHRYPFLLVDRIRELDPDRRIVGIERVDQRAVFPRPFSWTAGHAGSVDSGGIGSGRWRAGVQILGTVGHPVVYLTGIDGAKFRKPVVPGDILRLEVDVIKKRPPFWKMQGKAFVDTELVCEAEVTAMVTDKTGGDVSDCGVMSGG